MENQLKTTKAERRKKLTRVKDTLHKGLGKKQFSGIGDGEPLICDICGKRVTTIRIAPFEQWIVHYCPDTCDINNIDPKDLRDILESNFKNRKRCSW